MATRRFWRGFAAGAIAGAGGFAAVTFLIRALVRGRTSGPVVRLEKSIQIGRPVPEVFRSWSDLNYLAEVSDIISDVHVSGRNSHWRVNVDGRTAEWDAKIEQFIPDQAIGWKSLSGPRHTGRITFSPIGEDTLIQVTMNYAPPRIARPFAAPLADPLEGYIERVMRDFKAALEGKGQEGRKPPIRGMREVGPGIRMTQTDAARGTGTFGSVPEAVESPSGGMVNPLDLNPEKKS